MCCLMLLSLSFCEILFFFLEYYHPFVVVTFQSSFDLSYPFKGLTELKFTTKVACVYILHCIVGNLCAFPFYTS